MKVRRLVLTLFSVLALFFRLCKSEAKIGGWNYESGNPKETYGHQVVSRGSIIYAFGDNESGEYSDNPSLFERIWLFDTNSMSWSWRMSTGDIPPRQFQYCVAIRSSKVSS
eukprot:TRINITY_DN3334_c0_g1_i4.p1 TRINITY_DN3334_c0_g1~~TRINITY_DN3334_c0_g1_i4.p1  ORF type:complete len:111 (-),score=14.73 TRINITY_DN3334_c0_g1_i4:194-526(-)